MESLNSGSLKTGRECCFDVILERWRVFAVSVVREVKRGWSSRVSVDCVVHRVQADACTGELWLQGVDGYAQVRRG